MKQNILAALLCFAAITAHAQTRQWTYRIPTVAGQATGYEEMHADTLGGAALMLYEYPTGGGTVFNSRFVWLARNGKARITDELDPQVEWRIVRMNTALVILFDGAQTIRRYSLVAGRVVVKETTFEGDEAVEFGALGNGKRQPADPNGFFIFKDDGVTQEVRRYRN